MDAITRVGVIGCGQMGSGIAEVAARQAMSVLVYEPERAALDAGRRRITASLAKATERGKLTAPQADAALARLRFTTELRALAECQITVEAIVESPAAKSEIFAQLDELITDSQAVLASNTSSIPIAQIAAATTRPQRVIGVHFFNPVPVLPLVELVPSLLTAEQTVTRAAGFARALGKDVILASDRAGFVVNALLVPYILAAVRMCEGGFASAQDIDTGMVAGCAHPMGPLHLADLIGLDTLAAIAAAMYEEFKQPLYAAPPMLARMVEAGLLGRKSGRGFFDYTA